MKFGHFALTLIFRRNTLDIWCSIIHGLSFEQIATASSNAAIKLEVSKGWGGGWRSLVFVIQASQPEKRVGEIMLENKFKRPRAGYCPKWKKYVARGTFQSRLSPPEEISTALSLS